MVVITLPWPPTANTYWRRNGGTYFISSDGKAFRHTTALLCKKHRGAFGKDARLRVSVDAYPPDRRRRDLDNLCKCLLDSLEKAEVYVNDSQIDELCLRRKEVGRGEVCVTIDEISMD